MSRKRGTQHTQAYAAKLETRAILDDPVIMTIFQSFEVGEIVEMGELGKIDNTDPSWVAHCQETDRRLGVL